MHIHNTRAAAGSLGSILCVVLPFYLGIFMQWGTLTLLRSAVKSVAWPMVPVPYTMYRMVQLAAMSKVVSPALGMYVCLYV